MASPEAHWEFNPDTLLILASPNQYTDRISCSKKHFFTKIPSTCWRLNYKPLFSPPTLKPKPQYHHPSSNTLSTSRINRFPYSLSLTAQPNPTPPCHNPHNTVHQPSNPALSEFPFHHPPRGPPTRLIPHEHLRASRKPQPAPSPSPNRNYSRAKRLTFPGDVTRCARGKGNRLHKPREGAATGNFAESSILWVLGRRREANRSWAKWKVIKSPAADCIL